MIRSWALAAGASVLVGTLVAAETDARSAPPEAATPAPGLETLPAPGPTPVARDSALPPGPAEEAVPPLDPLEGVPADGAMTGGDAADGAESVEARFDRLLTEGERAVSLKRWREAIGLYEEALTLFDNDPAVLRGLAHARHAARAEGTCPQRAVEDLLLLEVYDPRNLWLRERTTALEWMAQCGDRYEPERLRISLEVASLPEDDPRRPEDIDLVAATLVWKKAKRLDGIPRENLLSRLDALLDQAQARAVRRKVQPAATIALIRFEAARAAGADETALAAYASLARTHPEHPQVAALKPVVEELEIQRSIANLARTRGGRPTPEAQAAYDAGRAALTRGDFRGAESSFRAAVEASPWFPTAQYELGQLLARGGKFAEAVEFLRRATLMEPTDYRAHMALGLVCLKEFKGARDVLAAKHLSVALRLRPDLYPLHFYLGELRSRESGEGAREQAQGHFRAFIERAPAEDPLLEDAREALRGLERAAAEERPLARIPRPPRAELERLDPELQRRIDEAFVVGAEYGDWARAQRLLLEARARFPDVPALLNELAKVSLALDAAADARGYWAESLTLDEAQPEVHERLANLAGDSEAASEHWTRAAELGSLRARYQLARRAFHDLRLLDASRHLDNYLRTASPYELDWAQATALRARLDQRLWAVGGVLGALLALMIGLWVRRVVLLYRGEALTTLLDGAPKSVPEVARVLSLIRHEVLKHNTSFLVDVGEGLARGAPDAGERARTLLGRLFEFQGQAIAEGTEDHDRARRGIYGRFLQYCQELESVGRAHGHRLNLRRRDPVFGPMLEAFVSVQRTARRLHVPGRVSAARRRRLGRRLAQDGAVLGKSASEQLAAMVEQRCVVAMSADVVRECFAQVAKEPQFAGLALSLRCVEEGHAPIRIFPSDLDDILTNILRNSMASAQKYTEGAIELGVAISRELDEITALETLAISILDQSPEPLTNEMLRGRYADRGMGITADLLSRYDGAVSVESRPGWSKAVVLRFFCAEEGA